MNFSLIITILSIIVSVLLIGIVLIQKSKGGGLSSQFGNASAVMGVRQTNTFLEKGTWWLFAFIIILSIASAYVTPRTSGSAIRSEVNTTAMPGNESYDTNPTPAPNPAPAQGE